MPKIIRGRDRKRTGMDLLLVALEIMAPLCFAGLLLSIKYFPVLVCPGILGHRVTYKHEKKKYPIAIIKHSILLPNVAALMNQVFKIQI